MSNANPSARYSLATLLEPTSLAKFAAIGAIVLAIIVLFLWTGGWLSAGRLTPTRMIDTFEDVNGLQLTPAAPIPFACAE